MKNFINKFGFAVVVVALAVVEATFGLPSADLMAGVLTLCTFDAN